MNWNRTTVRAAIHSAVLLSSGVAACVSLAQSPAEEPPLTLHLKIGNQTWEIESGKPSTITLDGSTKVVTVTTAAYRTFDKCGIRFEYPARFQYAPQKPEPEDGGFYCVMDGDRVTIYVKEHKSKLSTEEFTKYVREKHASLPNELTVKEQKIELKTAADSIEGISFEITGKVQGQQHFRQLDRCFLLPSLNKERCVFLIISLHGQELSQDAMDFLDLLNKSLTVGEND